MILSRILPNLLHQAVAAMGRRRDRLAHSVGQWDMVGAAFVPRTQRSATSAVRCRAGAPQR
ncbi:hypothetical protein CVM73_16000 [Bradyrhizobium forestalis]|uniref:Uncharacterized protein n=1 Tax=Bradyrhizobium forestalis TaxID=1419263 RepID=A0A2M8R926_9BRAD|nr:hypothetical protein CVM73_16000 [Bradyrhizobium forestalis]